MVWITKHLRVVIEIGLVVLALIAWREYRHDMSAAQKQQAQSQQQIADARKESALTSEQLKQQLAAIAAQKKTPATAQQIAAELDALHAPLEVPLEIAPRPAQITTGTTAGATMPNAPSAQSIIVPAQDATTLRNVLLDCQASKDRIGACTQELQDRTTEYRAAEHESAAWKQAAHGGSWLHRTLRAAEFVGIGVAVGYMAARR